MKNKRRILETAKTIAIAALTVSAVFLLVETFSYMGIAERFRGLEGIVAEGAEPSAGLQSQPDGDYAVPMAVAVCRNGGVAAYAYTQPEREDSFRHFSAFLGEALGSAGESEETGEEAFRKMLEGYGVFLRFPGPRTLGLLSSCLETEMKSTAASMETDLIFIGLGQEQVTLCYRDGSGRFFSCATAVSGESLRARIDGFRAPDAYFAYENEILSGCDHYFLVSGQLPEIRSVASENPVREGLDAERLLEAFGMNGYVAASYSENDGTTVYIDGDDTCRIEPDGHFSFSSSGQTGTDGGGPLQALHLASKAAERCAGALGADAEAEFVSMEADRAGGGYTVKFSYSVGGIAVDGEQWEIKVQNGSVTGAKLLLRRYVFTDGYENPLPALQAAALASEAGVSPRLVYVDRGESLECVWVGA